MITLSTCSSILGRPLKLYIRVQSYIGFYCISIVCDIMYEIFMIIVVIAVMMEKIVVLYWRMLYVWSVWVEKKVSFSFGSTKTEILRTPRSTGLTFEFMTSRL